MSNKRKGSDVVVEEPSASVVVSPSSHRGQQQRMAWSQCQQRLAAARKYLSEPDKDTVVKEFEDLVHRPTHFRGQTAQQLELADELCEKLSTKLSNATSARQHENQHAHEIQIELAEIYSTSQTLKGQLQEAVDAEFELKQEIVGFQQQADAELQGVQTEQLERQLQAPKLRHQLSLYAACTGIKWDYVQENVLAGEVDIPSHHELRKFSIDPLDFSPFDLTNKLWALMEGKDLHNGTASAASA